MWVTMAMYASCLILIVLVGLSVCGCPQSHPLSTDATPDPLIYHFYSRRCVTVRECKQRSFVIFRDSCVRACPPGTKYFDDERTCYTNCPKTTIQTDKRCLNGTYCDLRNQVLFNSTCTDKCPTVAPFIKYGTCYNSCPDNTVTYGTHCLHVDDCVENIQFYVFNHTCVTECPSFASFTYKGRCHYACPEDTVANISDTACFPVQKCIANYGYVVFNDTCRPSCGPHSPYLRKGRCYTQCPENFVLNNTKCISDTDCAVSSHYIYNRTCLKSCPVRAKYHLRNICYATCPKGFVMHNERCITERSCTNYDDLYSRIFNGTCVQSCPVEARYSNKGHCVGECPADTFVKDMQCIDNSDCIEYYNLYYNNQCVSECPVGARLIYEKKCVSQCPYPSVQEASQCISTAACLGEGKHIFNKTCHTSCPVDTFSYEDGRCYTECPYGTVVNRTMCVPASQCRRIFNKSCVSSCPSDSPYVAKNMCMERCPHNTYTNGSDCIPNSQCGTHKIYNSTCVATCPSEAQFTHENVCLQTCPSGFKAFADSKCVLLSRCKRFSNSTIIESEDSCMTSCPGFAPYAYKRNICVRKCPKDTVAVGDSCVSEYQCDGFMYDRRCFASCPPEAPYRQDSHCYRTCPENTVIQGMTCIYDFSCDGVIDNNTCILHCPKQKIYTKDKRCYSACPQNTVIDHNGTDCIYSYSCIGKNWFIVDNVCVPECPFGFVLDSPSRKCVDLKTLKLGAVIVSVLMVLSCCCLIYCIYNPKKLTSRRETSTQNAEGDDAVYAVDGINDYIARRERRQDTQEDEEELILMDERDAVNSQTESIVVEVHNYVDAAANDESLLCVNNDRSQHVDINSDDDALLFGNITSGPNFRTAI